MKKKHKNYKCIYNKQNNKNIYTSYRYVTIKIHSTISKLKKARLRIALYSKSKFDSL